MTPILCVGESLEEREAGGSETKVAQQIRRGFDKVEAVDAATSVVAYEPIWAIGTGRNAEPADAGRVVEVIRATLAERYDDEVAGSVRVQYGGSVKPGNIREFMAHPEIDGALVGGASLDPGGPRPDREVPLAEEERFPCARCSTSASMDWVTIRSRSSTGGRRSRPPTPRTSMRWPGVDERER